MTTATRLQIPWILGIGWWWLLIPCLIEFALSRRLGIPDWIPPLQAFWLLFQIVWLKIAEPRSRTLYWLLACWVLYVIAVKLPQGRDDVLTVLFTAGFFGCVFGGLNVFRNELEAHFNLTDPIGLDLGGWKRLPWMFVFNAFYFQFYFHKLYKKQRRIYRSLIAE